MCENDQDSVMYESAGMLTGDALPKDKMAWYGILEFGVILKAADENASSVVRVSAP